MTIYTTKGTMDFGKWKGTPIERLFTTPEGRNYLVWMKLYDFKMSAQLFEKVEAIHKANKSKNGKDYEYLPDRADHIDNYP